jgi:acetylglutamate kinase
MKAEIKKQKAELGVAVIKLGGSLLDDAERRDVVLQKIVARWQSGESIIVVHGGGKHIDAALAKAGIAKRTHAGLRITDDATLQIVVSVLGGAVNKMLVSELTKLGVRAAGISGCDGGTLIAEQHPPIDGVELGHVGRVTASNRTLVRMMLNYGILPVVSSLAMSESGAILNVNADSAASAIAVAHQAKELLFFTDVAGLLDADGALVPALDANGVEQMITTGIATGGMRPKLESALTALRAGVPQITIGTPATEQLSNRATEGGTTLVAA